MPESEPSHKARFMLLAQPNECAGPLSTPENLELRMGEVFGYLRGDRQNSAVGHSRHTVDLAMMITNEPYMSDKCGKALPTWERRGVDQQSGQLAIFLDERIDRSRERLEILGCESIPRLHHQHTGFPQEFEFQHGRVSRDFRRARLSGDAGRRAN